MRLCDVRRSHLSRGEFIPQRCGDERRIFAESPAMTFGFFSAKWGNNMIKKLLAVAAVTAAAYAIAPAQAAKVHSFGCSGPNLTKTESSVEAMADGPTKMEAQKEIAMAQDSMLNGKMGACGSHLGKAMSDASAK
jgi:hypothetical protein